MYKYTYCFHCPSQYKTREEKLNCCLSDCWCSWPWRHRWVSAPAGGWPTARNSLLAALVAASPSSRWPGLHTSAWFRRARRRVRKQAPSRRPAPQAGPTLRQWPRVRAAHRDQLLCSDSSWWSAGRRVISTPGIIPPGWFKYICSISISKCIPSKIEAPVPPNLKTVLTSPSKGPCRDLLSWTHPWTEYVKIPVHWQSFIVIYF